MSYAATDALEWIEHYWTQFADWFLTQPLFAQILIIVGIVAIIVLAAILVYYIVKGVAYLLYYLAKGLYHLFKAIILAFTKLFKAIYKSIQGRSDQPVPSYQQPQNNTKSTVVSVKNPEEISFCYECGKFYSDNVKNLLHSKGSAFCEQCGKNLTTNPIKVKI